jgi:hypothetical protein
VRCHALTLCRARVSGFAAAALPSGPLSHVHRLQLDCGDADAASASAPLSCVLKTAPRARADALADGARQLAFASRAFEREVGFHHAMAAEKRDARALPLPTAHFASYDKPSGRAALLLQDCEREGLVRADGAGTSAPDEQDAPVAHAALHPDAAPALVRTLAAHHARFWGGAPFALWRWLPNMDGTGEQRVLFYHRRYSFLTLRCPSAPLLRDFEPALCEAALPDALARFADVIPPPLRPYLAALPAAAAGPLLRRLASAPRTLLHGDARLANIFAPRALLLGEEQALENSGGESDASRCRFIDFGDAAAGRGAFDVACLLTDGMAPEDRCGCAMRVALCCHLTPVSHLPRRVAVR